MRLRCYGTTVLGPTTASQQPALPLTLRAACKKTKRCTTGTGVGEGKKRGCQCLRIDQLLGVVACRGAAACTVALHGWFHGAVAMLRQGLLQSLSKRANLCMSIPSPLRTINQPRWSILGFTEQFIHQMISEDAYSRLVLDMKALVRCRCTHSAAVITRMAHANPPCAHCCGAVAACHRNVHRSRARD